MTPSPSTQRTRAARRALRPAAWAAMTATAMFALTACGGGSDPLAENSGDAASGGSSDAVTVGSADFPESQVIAELYAGVLRDAGVTVETKPGIGAREAYVGAVKDGSVDVVPDYSGNPVSYTHLTLPTKA